jgi:large repetitive protein
MRLHRLMILGGLFAFVASGCGGCSRNQDTCVVSIRIESPDNERVIFRDEDENPSRAGVQITVEASVAACVTESSSAGLIVNDDPNTAREGFVRDASVIFEDITLVPTDAAGNVTLRAWVEDLNSGRTAQDTILVRLADAPDVDCLFSAPLDGAVLGPEDDVQPDRAGLQHDVTIQCATPLDGTPAQLWVDGTPIPSAIFTADSATFPAVHLSEGINVLRGRVTTEAGTWTREISVTVDTPDCEVRLNPAGAYVFNLDGDPPRIPGRVAIADADGDPTTGIQADLSALTPDCFGGEATLFVEGEPITSQAVQDGAVDFGRVALPDGDDVRAWVEVTSAEAEGPTGRSVTQSFWVDSVRPAPVVLFPAGGEVLRAGADKDGDPANGIQVDLYLEAPDLESFDDPSVAWRAALIEAHLVRTDTGEETARTCLVGIDGCQESGNPDRYRIELDLDVLGDYRLEVIVIDPAGNVGRETAIEFSVDARPVAVAITSPEADAVVNLTTPGVDGTRIPITVESDAPELEGAEVRVSCSGASTAASVIGSDGSAVVMVDFASSPCGGRQTSCIATVISDGVSYPSPAVEFRLDVFAPELTIVAPTDGDVIFETDVAVEVIALCLEDGQEVAVADAAGVTLGTSPAAGGAAVVALTLSSGTHALVASASDAAGNLGVSEAVSFAVSADPPEVVFVTPIDGLVLTEDDDVDAETGGVQYDVVVQVANEPVDTPVSLQVGYDDDGTTVWRAPVGTVTTTGSNRRATFPAVSLPEGRFALRAVATGALGLRGEATVWPRVNTGVATCNIVSPIDGVSIGPAHDASASSSTGVRHDVRVRTSLADGAEVVLSHTDAEGGVATLLGTVADGEAVFADVVFTTEEDGLHGQNLLDATCEDGAALTTVVNVDLEAPVAEILTPEDEAVFNASSLDASAQEGFQIQFRGAATNPGTGESVTAGASATLEVACTGVDAIVYPLSFSTYGDAVEARARPTLEDQSVCTLTSQVTDQAGNVSDPVTVTVRVDRVPPELEIVRPLDGRWFGIADDRLAADGFQQQVEVAYAGLEDGQPVRLFFIRASEDGAQVESSMSPHLVGAGTREGHLFNNATFTMASQDEVIVRVEVEDAAGNVTVDSVTVHIDTEAPQIAITRPEADRPCFNLLSDYEPETPGIQTQVDVATIGVADGLPMTLCGTNRDDGGTACSQGGFTLIGQQAVVSNYASLQPVTLMDGEQELVAEVQDLAGNFSVSDPVAVCADSVPPSVTSFEIPADLNEDGYLNADELDAVGGVVCFVIAVEGADDQILTVRTHNPSAGTIVGSGTVYEGAVTVCGTLAEGSHALEARVSDENGNPNLRSANPEIANPEAQRSLIVDTVAPTMSIASPPALVNAEIAGGEDVDPDLTFRVNSNAEGRLVTFYVNGGPVGQVAVEAGTASVEITLANGATHQLFAEVSDVAGNLTGRSREVTVDTTPPGVVITEPGEGALLNNNSVSMTVEVAGAEAGEALRVYRTDVAPETLLHETVVSATQPQSFSVSLPDGEATLVARAWDAAGNVGESAPVSVEIDTVGCSLVWTAPTGSSVVFNAADDEETGTPGLQTTLVAETADCSGLVVELFKNEATEAVDSQTAAGTPGQVAFSVTLQDQEAGSFTARIEDAFENVTTATFTFEVDITPPGMVRTHPASDRLAYVAPGNPTIGTTVNGFLRLEDSNPADTANAEAKFTFEVTGAEGGSFRLLLDGNVVHGPSSVTQSPQIFDVDDLLIPHRTDGVLVARVVDGAGNTTEIDHDVVVDVVPPAAPQLVATLDDPRTATVSLSWGATGDDGTTGEAAAVEVRWDVTPFDETGYGDARVGADLPGTATAEVLTPLPPLNVYTIAVRGRDAMDNLSPLVEGVNLLAVDNAWTKVEFPGDGGFFGYNMVPRGVDLNGSGRDDIVVTAMTHAGGGTSRGMAYLYYGSADPASVVPQTIPGQNDGEYFGSSVDAGDLTGDGVPTLVVGAYGYSAPTSTTADGRVQLIFGRTDGAALDPADGVTIRGREGAGGYFGSVVRILGDINQNGIPDLAINAMLEGPGRVYIFYGRSRSAWETLAEANGYIDVDEADLVLVGEANGDYFGNRLGYADLGDFSGDGGADFLVPAEFIGRAYVFRSEDVVGATGPIPAADAFQVLTGGRYPHDGFGFSVDGVGRHVLLTDRTASPPSAYLHAVGEDGLVTPALRRIRRYTRPGEAAPGGWGWSTTHGDLTGNGLPDLVVGTNGTATHRVDVYFNQGLSPWYPDLPPDAFLVGSNAMGASVWMGDFTGDGLAEVAAGGSSGSGRLFLWHPSD